MRKSPGNAVKFIQAIQKDHDGIARVEIEVRDLKVEVEGKRIWPVRGILAVKLLVGTPALWQGKLVYPREVPVRAVYEVTRDGKMGLDQMFTFIVARALNEAWPGSGGLV
jgi:hypothetical protein